MAAAATAAYGTGANAEERLERGDVAVIDHAVAVGVASPAPGVASVRCVERGMRIAVGELEHQGREVVHIEQAVSVAVAADRCVEAVDAVAGDEEDRSVGSFG